MKTTDKFRSVMILTFMVFTLVSCKSGKHALTNEYKITLFVDTSTLDVLHPETSCRFEVDPEGADITPSHGDKVKKFKVKVKLAGKERIVSWTGKSEGDAKETIAVKRIVHVGGQNTFKLPEMEGVEGEVNASAKTKTIIAAYRYHLYFTVGNSEAEYIIDPKLMVK